MPIPRIRKSAAKQRLRKKKDAQLSTERSDDSLQARASPVGGEQEFALLESALFGIFPSMIKESSLRSVVGKSSGSRVTATAFLEEG